jgi:hypothetical protein
MSSPSWAEWEGTAGEHVLAWVPDYVDDAVALEEGIAFARRLGTLVSSHDVGLQHSWVLVNDEWDYELITVEQAEDAQELEAGAVILATLLVRFR